MKKSLTILGLAFLLFVGVQAHAAVAFDATTNGGALSASPKTYTHTDGSGVNRLLIVCTFQAQVADSTTGVTYGGSAMTKVTTVAADAGINIYRIDMWYLLNPAAGANSVVITTSSGTVSGLSTSYTGAGAPEVSTANGPTAGITSLTTSVTTLTDTDWTVLCGSGGSGNPSAGTGTTARQVGGTLSAPGGSIFGDSNAAITPPASHSMTFTQATSQNMNAVMAAITPFVASPASGLTKTIFTGGIQTIFSGSKTIVW